MKLSVASPLALRIAILLLTIWTICAEDGMPILLLAATGLVDMSPKDPWLPEPNLRESLTESCKSCMPSPSPPGRNVGLGKVAKAGFPVRRNSNCDTDGTCLLRLGRIGFRPGSVCGGDWHLIPGGSTDVQANHVFCVCPNLPLGKKQFKTAVTLHIV